MKRLSANAGVAIVACSLFVPLCVPVGAQSLTTDYNTYMTWQQDIQNYQKLVQTYTQGGQQLQNAIQQTQSALKNAKTMTDVQQALRNGQAEWTSLQSLVKVGNGVTVASDNATSAIKALFPAAPGGVQTASMVYQNQQNTQALLTSAMTAADVRQAQMTSEEAQLTAIKNQVLSAQKSDLGTNQLLQINLQLTQQMLEEMRSMERLMIQQQRAQSAYWYANGSDQVRQAMTRQAEQQIFRPVGASPSP